MALTVDQARNSRDRKASLRIYTAAHAVLLAAICIGMWILTARANSRGIQPNATLGFRSQATLASLRGWYVAQRVGFHFVAIGVTAITVAVYVALAFVFIRRSSPMWILIVPIIGGIAIGGCFLIAGQRADKAATSVETPKPSASMTSDCSADCPGQRVQIRYAVKSAGAATGDLIGEVPDLRSVLTLATRPA